MMVVTTTTTLDREVSVTIQPPENNDGDFTIAPAILTFGSTKNSVTVTVTAEVDFLNEPDQEHFTLTLMSSDDTSLDFLPSTLTINDTSEPSPCQCLQPTLPLLPLSSLSFSLSLYLYVCVLQLCMWK